MAAAREESTFIVAIAFTDENDSSVVPETIVWSLTDVSGDIINDRENIPVTPAASINIVLSGDDLALPDSTDPGRVLSVLATYNSSLGDDLPITESYRFNILDNVAI